ncbi:hypothetical protein GYMLUDRAFT_154415 [Collybiopsis luxurians FD-317 M1]|nr:hypothetical protein GYMLUDRAFT_154415 [Collybiopsis luxurians FD-317 M1]
MQGKRPARPQDVWCPDVIWDLTTRCWAQSAEDRLSATKICDILQCLPGSALPIEAEVYEVAVKENQQSGHAATFGLGGATLEPVVLLPVTGNRWDRKLTASVDPDSPEIVDRKVKALLNKLTMKKFDSISDQIIAWANKSEKEKDGRTLIQVTGLILERASDVATWPEMYARFCWKMMTQISPEVQVYKNSEEESIAGGHLFQRYLLDKCQEDFERGWGNRKVTGAAADTKTLDDRAAKIANKARGEKIVPYSDEYYTAQKAKRQRLGLIKFIGELFKLQTVTDTIIHECVKQLLGNVDNPEEDEVESLCKLLATAGQMLDIPKARVHTNVYFDRMKKLAKSQNISSRMQFMLQDIIELRDQRWQQRNAVAAPTTIVKLHEAVCFFFVLPCFILPKCFCSFRLIGGPGETHSGERGLYPTDNHAPRWFPPWRSQSQATQC